MDNNKSAFQQSVERDQQAISDFLAGTGSKLIAIAVAALVIWGVVSLFWK